MTQSDKVNRQRSIETGLTQAMGPMFICATEKSVAVKNSKPKVPEQLDVPHTTESRMAKMKKKISSPLVKKKSGLESSANKIFGCPLGELLKKDQTEVPRIVTRIVHYIEMQGMDHEGLFRISGNHRVVETLKATFDRAGDADLEGTGDVMAAAGLLKLFLRDLPEPLISQKLNDEFVRIHKTYGVDNKCLPEIRRLLEKLPEPNYQLIKFLCQFLVKVSLNESNNKMSSTALAIVFGPNLFRCDDGIEGLQQQGHTNAIVCKFIQEYDALFMIDHEVSPYATSEIFVQEARFNRSPGVPRKSNVSPKIDHEVTPYATSEIFVQEARFNPSPGIQRKSNEAPPKADKGLSLQVAAEMKSSRQIVHESSTSDEDSAHAAAAKGQTEEPIYACVKKPATNLHPPPSVSSSSDDLDLYVRSVSPSMNQSNSLLQKTIKDSIKEHLFGPDLMSTDENSPHSQESGDEAPPLPARRYENDENARQRRRRKKNMKAQKEETTEGSESPLSVRSRSQENLRFHSDVTEQDGDLMQKPMKKRPKSEAFEMFEKKGIIIGVDKNCNNILSMTYPQERVKHIEDIETENLKESETGDTITDEYAPEDDEFCVKRNSALLSSLTTGRAPPPKNRRRPTQRKREDSKDPAKSFVHPLVEQAKKAGVVSSPPPKSPRSARAKAPSSPKSPRRETGIDEVDMAPRSSPLTTQYKKRHHPLHVVPPLELYKLQQGEAEDVRLSPREKYDRFSVEEALLSPRSRPLSIDTKGFTHPTECPPSPPHEQVDHQWFDRRDSPKGDVTVKQLTKTISQLKKKVREFEDDFEETNGRRPSQSEKAPIKKYVSDLGRARKQLREMKEKAKGEAERLSETVPAMGSSNSSETLLTTTPLSVQQSLKTILNKLKDKRIAGARPEEIDSMTEDQLHDEKFAVQKALLQHESVFGRPTSKKDKDVMRPLYDRYRFIKRRISGQGVEFVGRSPGSGAPRKSSDLAPIHEDAPLDSPQGIPRVLSQSLPIGGIKETKKVGRPLPKLNAEDDEDLDDTVKLEDTLTLTAKKAKDPNTCREDAKFHEMSVEELKEQLEIASKDKKKLRKKLKKFEDDFLEQTGRRIQKEDRGDMAEDYHQYKEIKHRLRLTEALLMKAQAAQTI